MRPLDGLRVIDAATIVAGPFAASILGEFGAEVIKVEQPSVGDPMRRLGTQSPGGDTYWWFSETRNKRSVELDLRTNDGAAAFRALASNADIVIENYRTGTMDAWGLGFERLREGNQRLIQLSLSGFGRTGPLAQAAGVARIAEAFCGMTDLTGIEGEQPGLSGSAALADYVTGVYGALGIMLAVEYRHTSGRGQLVDLALYDGVARFLDELVPVFAATGVGRARMGAETHRSVPHSNYLANDHRWVTIACTNDRMFDRLTEAMGRPELMHDQRCATNEQRLAHRNEVNGIVADWVAGLPAATVVARAEAAGVPCSIVNTVADFCAHEQVVVRQSIIAAPTNDGGEMQVAGVVPRLDETPGSVQRLGATLGEEPIADLIARWADQLPTTRRPEESHVAIDE